MQPPKDDARSAAGEGGNDDGGIDLRALVARVEQCEKTLDDRGKRIEQCEKLTAAIVETLDRDLQFAAKELRTLLS